MKKELSAEEIWSTIESQHCPEKTKVGRSYSMTLSNGITYIYQVLPNGQLLSIDDWFEGYVEILGSQEAGLIYAVKFEKTLVNFYEYFGNSFNSEPTISLKYTKKKIDELKIFAKDCAPVRIVQDYIYDKKRYWVIESYDEGSDGLIIVYNITDKKIQEKCRSVFLYQMTDCAVVYRFPFAPHRYGIITESMPYYFEVNNIFYIIDFLHNKRKQILDCGYRNLHIYEYGDNRYAIYAYKKHSPVAYFKYDETENQLEAYTYYNDLKNPHSKNKKFKVGDLKVINQLIIKEFWPNYNHIEESVKSLIPIKTVVPDDKFMNEGITGSFLLSHITSNGDEEVILVKEFVDFLVECKTTADFVQVDYYIHRLSHLGKACKVTDSKRLYSFIDSILSRLRTKKYLLSGSEKYLKIELFVHNISFGDICSHMVEEHCSHWIDGEFKREIIPVDFYHNCSFDISIRISIDFDPQREKYQPIEDVPYDDFDNKSTDEIEISLDSIFDLDNSDIEEEPPRKEDSPGDKFYKFCLPQSDN